MNEIQEVTKGRYEGVLEISDRTFENQDFESFAINPKEGSKVKFKNCIFRNCNITEGAFQIGHNVEFENVIFDNIGTGGDLSFSSGAKFSGTKIISGNTKDTLWIKNYLQKEDYSNNAIDLDITEFQGEVYITGTDTSRIKTNPEKHIIIKKVLLENTGLKLNRANFFRASASKVKVNGGTSGVFSLPERYSQSPELQEQLEYFRSNGCAK